MDLTMKPTSSGADSSAEGSVGGSPSSAVFATPSKNALPIYKSLYDQHLQQYPDRAVPFETFCQNVDMGQAVKMAIMQQSSAGKKETPNRSATKRRSAAPQSGQEGSSRKRKRAVKDPNAPKRAVSAFFHFCAAERLNVRRENPGLSMTETSKELGRRWSVISADAKAYYEKLAAQDRERYEAAKAAYDQQKGSATAGSSVGSSPALNDPYEDLDDTRSSAV